MPRIYIHIGLPKTGTTTLQKDFFPYVDSSNYEYLGVIQPRKSYEGIIFKNFFRTIDSGEQLASTREELSKALCKNRSLIISEEMLTVTTPSSTWEEKLLNLSTVLEGLDYKILITLREPAEASFSFYVELFHRYLNSNLDFPDIAIYHPDFKIFNYQRLIQCLDEKFISTNITFAPFEALSENNLTPINMFLDDCKMNDDYSGISDNNSKRYKGNSIIIPKYRRSKWLDRLQKFMFPENQKTCQISPSGLKAFKYLENIQFGNYHLPKATEAQLSYLRSYFSPSTQALYLRSGIDYRAR